MGANAAEVGSVGAASRESIKTRCGMRALGRVGIGTVVCCDRIGMVSTSKTRAGSWALHSKHRNVLQVA